MLPEYVPDAVGGAAGLVGGLGAFGGFLPPPMLAAFVQLAGVEGYARGFLLETALALAAIIVLQDSQFPRAAQST